MHVVQIRTLGGVRFGLGLGFERVRLVLRFGGQDRNNVSYVMSPTLRLLQKCCRHNYVPAPQFVQPLTKHGHGYWNLEHLNGVLHRCSEFC